MTAIYELEMVGGPWRRRLSRRRAQFDDLPWHEAAADASPDMIAQARWVWTQSSFSEYASAASFAEIASALMAAGAPIDLIAAAGEFVVDEMLHAELSARVAMALGGALPLEVDLERLVRPAACSSPLLRAAELVVRTSCVGEALTIPVLKTAAAHAQSPLVVQVIAAILRDESAHAEIGPWFLDWAEPRLSEQDRAHLGRVASDAVRAFSPLFGSSSGACSTASLATDTHAAPSDDPDLSGGTRSSDECAMGVLDCAQYDAAFSRAIDDRVRAPLALRGIELSN